MQDPEMATTPSSDAKVTEFAGQLFFRLWRASHTRTAEELESVGLTPALFGLLNVLEDRPGTNQQEIGSAMGIDPSTMVSLIDQLEEAGLAKRRPHRKDRRAREVAITPRAAGCWSGLGRWRPRCRTRCCAGSSPRSVANC